MAGVQCVDQGRHVWITVRGVSLQARQAHGFQILGHKALGHSLAGHVAGAGHGAFKDLLQHLVEVLPEDQRFAGEHLEKDRAQPVHVGAFVGGAATRLLGRHIEGGAKAPPGLGELQGQPGLAGDLFGPRGSGFAPHLGQAPVQHGHFTKRSHQQIGGLEVAVHHARVVGVFQGLGSADQDLNPPGQGVGGLGGTLLGREGTQDRPQVAAFELLHGEVDPAGFVAADLVYRRRARVGDVGGDPGLA